MNKYKSIVRLLALTAMLAGCEKDIMDYEGVDGIYFDVQYGNEWGNESLWAHQNYTHVSFGMINASEYEVRMKVGVAGSVVDYDRPFRVEVVKDSSNAVLGEDFTDFSEDQVIKAGENKTYVTFTALRTDRMMTDTVKIQFRLVPGEYFTLPFSEIGSVPGRWKDTKTAFNVGVDPGAHTVFINNILTKPVGWVAVFGEFSPKKYQLLMDVSGYEKDAFEEQMKMLKGRGNMIAAKAKEFLMEQYNLGRDYWVLDEDGSMMWVSGVSWAEGTRPEEMID